MSTKKPTTSESAGRETQLDEAIDDTFPASDPVAPGTGAKKPASPRKKGSEDAVEHELDEALDDTFPASDPPAVDDPDHRQDRRKP